MPPRPILKKPPRASGNEAPMTIEFRLTGAIRHDPEAQVYVSYCPALQLYSQGETEPEARAALEGAVRMFLEACLHRGQLDAALRKCGLTLRPDVIPVDDKVSEYILIKQQRFGDVFPFDVPLNLFGSPCSIATAGASA